MRCSRRCERDETRHSPCVMTSIPAGFQGVLPFQPLTHMAPRLIVDIVPSPSPNFTPDLTYYISLIVPRLTQRRRWQLTSGKEPLRVTAESIQCGLESGKSSGVLSVVALSQPSGASDAPHCIVSHLLTFEVRVNVLIEQTHYSIICRRICTHLVVLVIALHVPI